MRKFMVTLCVGVILLVATFGASAQTDDAWIPGLGSFVLPGLGQLLNDQMDRALVHFGVSVAIWTLGILQCAHPAADGLRYPGSSSRSGTYGNRRIRCI